jgi:hypothetical protein
MPDSCIKRRLLFACRQTYKDAPPGKGTPVGWESAPWAFTSGRDDIDHVLVGRVPEGIVVAFRGTLAPFSDSTPAQRAARDWINNIEFLARDNPTYPGRVHAGFARSVNGLWPSIKQAIRDLIRPGVPNTLYITGHSKGGALANLAAWRALGTEGLDPPIRVFTIAAARAGNEDFRTAYHAHGGIRCLRYEAARDVVPLVPLGGDTPRWAKPLIRAVWGPLGDNHYVSVGKRVPASAGVLAVFGANLRALGPRSLGGDFLRELAAAHSIDSGTEYDTLVCDGEPGCTHG